MSKFLNGGTCPVPECEVVLVLEDESRLYACKHRLATISKFFSQLFHGNFKEKHMEEIEINDISKSELLLFLECAAEQIPTDLKPIPSDVASLCTLISLADQFMCELLKDRILSHLSSDAMFEAPAATKQMIIETAYIHRDGCVHILEACVRLCAVMETKQVAQLHNKIGRNALAAIYAFKGRTPPVEIPRPPPGTFCTPCNGFHSVCRKGTWYCRLCNRFLYSKPIDYSQFKTSQVDKDLLT